MAAAAKIIKRKRRKRKSKIESKKAAATPRCRVRALQRAAL